MPIIRFSPSFQSLPARCPAAWNAVIGPCSMVAAPPPTAPLMLCFTMKSRPRADALTTGCQHSTGRCTGRGTSVRSFSV